jgi:hypothetical protein
MLLMFTSIASAGVDEGAVIHGLPDDPPHRSRRTGHVYKAVEAEANQRSHVPKKIVARS